jgi:hypothetical protein
MRVYFTINTYLQPIVLRSTGSFAYSQVSRVYNLVSSSLIASFYRGSVSASASVLGILGCSGSVIAARASSPKCLVDTLALLLLRGVEPMLSELSVSESETSSSASNEASSRSMLTLGVECLAIESSGLWYSVLTSIVL